MKRSAILLFLFLFVSAFAIASPDKPNILFIMSDDHTTQAFGCYGSRIGISISKRHPVRNHGVDCHLSPALSGRECIHQACQEYLKRCLRCVMTISPACSTT